MSRDDRQFLNGIVRKVKPNVIVELGVSADGSSSVILNAIKDIPSKLYSFDYNRNYYRDPAKKVGYIVREIMPNITVDWDVYARDEVMYYHSDKWDLYTGGFPSKHLYNISKLIDICFIDTGHINPIEHLNILVILPYMKKNGIIILHDRIYPGLRVYQTMILLRFANIIVNIILVILSHYLHTTVPNRHGVFKSGVIDFFRNMR